MVSISQRTAAVGIGLGVAAVALVPTSLFVQARRARLAIAATETRSTAAVTAGANASGGLESAGRRDLLFDLVEQGLDARFDIVPDRPDRVEVLSVGVLERPVSDIDV